MPFVSPFERQLIDAALPYPGNEAASGAAVALMPDTDSFHRVFQQSVCPAFRDCGFLISSSAPVFDSGDWLADVGRFVRGAEIIVADVTGLNADVMYVLGLCHGLGRCPLIIGQDLEALPFNLASFRNIPYADSDEALYDLRSALSRAIRVFLSEAQASREKRPD